MRRFLVIVAVLLGTAFSHVAVAQTPPPTLLLVAIEDPNATDPTAKGINAGLADALGGAGFTIVRNDATYALDAIAHAPAQCAASQAVGLFVPTGRYEQTEHETPVPFVGKVIHYSTHVELRLDEIGCDGSIRWSTTTTADVGRSGVLFKPGNVGADVDAAFHTAVIAAVKARVAATVVEPSAPAAPSSPAAAATTAPLDVKAPVLLVPIEEPGIADPHAADMTHSLVLTMQKRGMTVKTAGAIDHNTVVHDASTLCSANDVQGIVVPHVRIEQSGYSGRSHAAFFTTLLSCDGVPLAHGANDADMPGGAWFNFTASATGVFERAVAPTLDALYAPAKLAT